MNSLAPEQTRMPVQPLLIIFFDIIKLILLKKIIVQEILSQLQYFFKISFYYHLIPLLELQYSFQISFLHILTSFKYCYLQTHLHNFQCCFSKSFLAKFYQLIFYIYKKIHHLQMNCTLQYIYWNCTFGYMELQWNYI